MSLYSFWRRASVGLGVTTATAVVLLGLTAVAGAQTTAPPTTAWPVLEVANPSAGTTLSSGDYIISGNAYDPLATEGSGVSRVDVFLGDRDQGGLFLGSAVPGKDAIPDLTPGSPMAMRSFQLTVNLPTTITGGHDLIAYAYSAASGMVTTVSTPIYLAIEPTPMATPAPQPVAVVGHILPVAAAAATTFSLGNPNAGDVVSYGDYIVSGAADASIDHVLLFMDERDTGGTLLGTATPTGNGTFQLTVKIPTNFGGGHNFVAYAVSTTGLETKVSVPIYIGVAPTPTPRPSSEI